MWLEHPFKRTDRKMQSNKVSNSPISASNDEQPPAQYSLHPDALSCRWFRPAVCPCDAVPGTDMAHCDTRPNIARYRGPYGPRLMCTVLTYKS
eukprot:3495222-Rhodomonas_salina.3